MPGGMRMDGKRPVLLVALACLALMALATPVSAGYLDPIRNFICVDLVGAIRRIGNTLGILMFVYGGAKYAYSADDPGARKQALGICSAAVIAMIIIMIAKEVIDAIGAMLGVAGAVGC